MKTAEFSAVLIGLAAAGVLAGCSGIRPARLSERLPYASPGRKIQKLTVVVDNQALWGVRRAGPKSDLEYTQPLARAVTDALGAAGVDVLTRRYKFGATADLIEAATSSRDPAHPIDAATFSPDAVLRLTLVDVTGDMTNLFGPLIRGFDFDVTLQEPEGDTPLWRAHIHAGVSSGWQSWRNESMTQVAVALAAALKRAKVI